MLQGALMSCRSATLCAPMILCLLAFLTRPAAHGESRPPATLPMNRPPTPSLSPLWGGGARRAGEGAGLWKARAGFLQRLARTKLVDYLYAKGPAPPPTSVW